MNSDEVIRMAEEAGLVRFEGGELEAYGIAEASHDDHSRACWRIADEQRLKRFAELIAAAEREACAKVAEERLLDKANCTAEQMYEMMKKSIAEAIRARGQK
jgi:hypothetical protein